MDRLHIYKHGLHLTRATDITKDIQHLDLMELCPLLFYTYFSCAMSEDLVLLYNFSRVEHNFMYITLHNISQHEHHLTEPPGVLGLDGVRGLEGARGMTNRSTMRTALIGSRPDAALHLLGNFLV